jgi:hypothetical protein
MPVRKASVCARVCSELLRDGSYALWQAKERKSTSGAPSCAMISVG